MSSLKISRVKSYIEQHFSGLIDLSSVPEGNREAALLTRGTAALAIISYTGCSFNEAAAAIVDGGDDKGIDAIYYDSYTNTAYFAQSKWHNDGTKTIDESAAHKLKYGVQKLLDLNFDGCNEAIQKKKAVIEKITNDATVKISLCLAFNSNNILSDSVKNIIDEYISTVNCGDEIMNLVIANQNKLYEVASKSRGPVNEDIVIRNWIKIDSGHSVYFGHIATSDLAILFDNHQDSLFAPNIRSFKGATEVNNAIVESIVKKPEAFCYLNNGITIIANEINKKPLGGASRESGIFECKGLAIVNGAQTVGACSRANKIDGNKCCSAYVMARVIETGEPDNELSVAITKAANTQNKIERKDFVALDPFQKELKEGLDILGIQYTYKTGEDLANNESVFDLAYVTQAIIADTTDINLIAIAKREIGKVWDDINKAPYKRIFNPTNNPYYVKNILLLFEVIQNIIKNCALDDRRKIQYTVHGNIFIAAQCLSRLQKAKIREEAFDLTESRKQLERIVPTIFSAVVELFEAEYPGAYLAHLFRNRSKLQELHEKLMGLDTDQ